MPIHTRSSGCEALVTMAAGVAASHPAADEAGGDPRALVDPHEHDERGRPGGTADRIGV